ncbi:unnamed protein product [Allacma fusca]|uniref:Uncharacterized protein n=1 Tax=Allacma fusca TaxID=39272 RepID=A0A8J2K5U2_9HEXA|nr:unnamed protein product [Allacma fusca]
MGKTPENDVAEWVKRRVRRCSNVGPKIGSMAVPFGGTFTVVVKMNTTSNTCNTYCTLQIVYFLFTYTNTGKTFFSRQLNISWELIDTKLNDQNFDSAKNGWLLAMIGNIPPECVNLYGNEFSSVVAPLVV